LLLVISIGARTDIV